MDLIGDASKARIIAFIIDNLLACLVSILTVGLIHTDSSIVGGAVLCSTYLGYFLIFESALVANAGKVHAGSGCTQYRWHSYWSEGPSNSNNSASFGSESDLARRHSSRHCNYFLRAEATNW